MFNRINQDCFERRVYIKGWKILRYNTRKKIWGRRVFGRDEEAVTACKEEWSENWKNFSVSRGSRVDIF